MAMWSREELDRIANTEELHLTSFRKHRRTRSCVKV